MRKTNAEESYRTLGEALPDNINRRSFIAATVGASVAGLAGCTGEAEETGGDGPSGGSGGDETDLEFRDTTWTADWAIGSNNIATILAHHEGFLEDFGVSITDAVRGEGSGNTTRLVGTGDENTRLGKANVIPVLTGIDSGQDVKIFATDRPRSALGLIYRPDRIDDPTSYTDKRVGVAPSLEDTYALYEVVHGLGTDGNLANNLDTIEESAHPAVLSNGDVDAIWHTTDTYAEFIPQVDVELVFEPMFKYEPVIEDVLITNGEWLAEGDNLEFVANCLTAHSHAAKWIMLNPEEAVDIMQNELNPDLQIVERETLVVALKTGFIALALMDEIKEIGYNFMDESLMTDTVTVIEETYGIELPAYEEYVALEVQQEADLATFTDDEWDQIIDYTGEWADILE
jgi:ABC-type nitrate/sulfonate/bicarbonate transport system substrate-binding protein